MQKIHYILYCYPLNFFFFKKIRGRNWNMLAGMLQQSLRTSGGCQTLDAPWQQAEVEALVGFQKESLCSLQYCQS